jgi:hypothetical protein
VSRCQCPCAARLELLTEFIGIDIDVLEARDAWRNEDTDFETWMKAHRPARTGRPSSLRRRPDELYAEDGTDERIGA